MTVPRSGCLVLPRFAGTPLLALPRPARLPFAAQLRAFADALHALSLAATIPIDDVTPEQWLVEARETWAAVRDEVPANARDAIETLLAASAPTPAERRVLLHGDLGAEHIVVDGDRITGVIDWSDAVIGDPALDHGRLLRDLGPTAGGGERTRFYALCTAIEDLAYGLETGRDSYRTNALAALNETVPRD